MQITVVPTRITPEILKLCGELVPGSRPQFLAVTPVEGVEVKDCFPAVARQVRDHGGSICHGWQIWEWPGVMLEAEFHAVWRTPNGQLRDITPKPEPIPRILFLPDPSRKYSGRQVNNVRRALSTDPRIADFIRCWNDEYEFMNRGARAEQHGRIVVNAAEAAEYEAIQRRKVELQTALIMHRGRPGRNDPCPCGSGKKYKKCCGS
jgi:hypothetical protein